MSLTSQIRAEVRPLLRLAIPLVLAELGWSLMNFVDLAMVGRLGANAIAAVSVGSAVFIMMALIGEGTLLGLDALVSQQYGAGRLEECHRSLVAAFQFSLPVGLVLTSFLWFAAPAISLLGMESTITAQAVPFFRAMSLGFAPLLLFFSLRRYLQALHLVRIISFTVISANIINFAFNYVLIFGHFGFPALGPTGSGYSTTLSRLYMLAVLAIYTLYEGHKRDFHLLSYLRTLHRERIREIIRLGAPAAMQIALEVGVFSASTLLAGRLGAVAVSGHQIALSLASATFMVPLGVSSATAVKVGNAVGRQDAEGANAAGWAGIAVSAGFMTCAAVVFWTVPQLLAGIFTHDRHVLSLAISLISIAAIFQFFDGVQVTTIGALRGSGNTRIAMLTNIFGWWIVGLPLGAYLCFERGWGARGLWAGLCTGLILIGSILAVAWRRRMRQMRETLFNEVAVEL